MWHLFIIIPLWIIAVSCVITILRKGKEADEIESQHFRPCAGIQINKMDRDLKYLLWVIKHPFQRDILLQLVHEQPEFRTGSFPYVDSVEMLDGELRISFTKPVENMTAIIVGERLDNA